MTDLDAIRKRDADSAETWFKQPPLDACGRAFIDRRALLGEIDRLRGVLSVIAGYGEEDNEWDAVDRYKDVREMAGKAVSPLPPEPQSAEHGDKHE